LKETRILMGMPITVEIVDPHTKTGAIDAVFEYFRYIDEKFSTYKEGSEISKINRGEISPENYSEDMKLIFLLSEETKKLTDGYFDIVKPDGSIDPSGLVKGWAIYNAAEILRKEGYENFFVEAGGDIQTYGGKLPEEFWKVGIRNPFEPEEMIQVVEGKSIAMATSGTYERGRHIYNPKTKTTASSEIVSLTVIGPNVYEADRFVTAAFAMGKNGIQFIEQLDGFEGYMIDKDGLVAETLGFKKYTGN
jgi:FAD:protein FMN transferase